jgi:hypothetical protein
MSVIVRLQREAFDTANEIAALTRSRTDIGAVVTFTGICRADENGEPIAALNLEHYPDMAEAEIGRHIEAARQRWPLLGVTVIHPSLRPHRARRGHCARGDGTEPSRGGLRGCRIFDGLSQNPPLMALSGHAESSFGGSMCDESDCN